MKINPKNQLTLRFSHQYNQGPDKPAEEFLDESTTENEEKKTKQLRRTLLGIISSPPCLVPRRPSVDENVRAQEGN